MCILRTTNALHYPLPSLAITEGTRGIILSVIETAHFVGSFITHYVMVQVIRKSDEAQKNLRIRPGSCTCLLYTSDAADDTPCVDLGGRRIIKKKSTGCTVDELPRPRKQQKNRATGRPVE